jgi:hypothetical protein
MCDCPSDWVMCLRVGCERAIALNMSYQQQVKRVHEILGDLRIIVSMPSDDTGKYAQ